ncbi:sensor histidine kinase [Ruminiclostridium cellobioparum]|uniref:Integral membrane sensor signal transduction histidine kinase n=1 Tax=Ruminiclostridium cellobioparum subsp. termitidis CT1112 TaxID=1195236 RepID=S0FVK3_RUMCE|nr:histidine kinase [Ruminiclostridium cellobioparum]EMS72578.1 integral membrane sensor signal transduction histidine kinase [Ruminiclostridium cellobioparum subsp. termitidis CT1112]
MNKDRNFLLDNIKKWVWMILMFIILLLALIGFAATTIPSYKVVLVLIVLAFFLIVYIGYISVYLRYRQMEKLLQLYTEGYFVDDFFEQDIKISKTVSKVLELLSDRLDKSALLNVSKKQAQYLALQNQINPHFLYNTLEGIRSEALCAGMDGVASMTEALATFFRYTISNVDHLVTLEDELSNIENYYIIQQFRFGDKLSLSIEYDDDGDDLSILNLKLPKLILQPIVENSIYHGIERKIGKGNLRIHIDYTADRLIIRISDDGMGIEKEALDKLNNKLLTNSLDDMESKKEKKGGIAIINVNNRIKLIFGEKYGIYIYSTQNVGTDVEITLPIIKE